MQEPADNDEHQPLHETPTAPVKPKRVPWTAQEHRRFLVGLEHFGLNKVPDSGTFLGLGRACVIAEVVGTKTEAQVRSHAQKHFQRLLQKQTLRCEGKSNICSVASSVMPISANNRAYQPLHETPLDKLFRTMQEPEQPSHVMQESVEPLKLANKAADIWVVRHIDALNFFKNHRLPFVQQQLPGRSHTEHMREILRMWQALSENGRHAFWIASLRQKSATNDCFVAQQPLHKLQQPVQPSQQTTQATQQQVQPLQQTLQTETLGGLTRQEDERRCATFNLFVNQRLPFVQRLFPQHSHQENMLMVACWYQSLLQEQKQAFC